MENKLKRSFSIISLFLILVVYSFAHGENQCQNIYTSKNLSGHIIAAECNPGGGTNCTCSDGDVSIAFFADHGEVTSNVQENHTYVNAIGHKKFSEAFPNGNPIHLGIYKYTAYVKLPIVPAADPGQSVNPDAMHVMIQLYDGRDALFENNKTTLEGAIYWDLNPWGGENYGKIKIYTRPIILVDTGKKVTPDTNWHKFEIMVDFASGKYVFIAIDEDVIDVGSHDLAQVHHPDWGEDVSIITTTESMAAWPGNNCAGVFKWTTQFKDLAFSQCRDSSEFDFLLFLPSILRKKH
jgi:hypothetical protein